ncbi:MAG: SsrA-binding protein SmpB [Planctomycetaceae bacterium]|nr:SsrA-binding protein SmpB [Planctomycetaceae bacterium]
MAENRKARHEYSVLDSLECGIILVGSEVKSLRAGTAAIGDAFGKVRNGEVFLVNCDIAEYVEANRFNHKPKRERKLLLHRREIKRFAMRAYEKGLTLVPLRMYFKEGKAKVLMGLCKGKQEFDKRDAKKKAEIDKRLRLSMMKRTR